MPRYISGIWLFVFAVQTFAWVFNNPYPDNETQQKIYYSSFNAQPKTLDPAKAYSSNEFLFIMQIYEPLLQYDYFRRPYQLAPLIATKMPEQRVQGPFSIYTIQIKNGILYQPHPAFAKDEKGNYRYLNLPRSYLRKNNINTLADFPYQGTRELTVDDYIYQIKRLANPQVNSPIYGLMSEHIYGFKEFGKTLKNGSNEGYLDLRNYPLIGIKKKDDYTFEIWLNGPYSQFLFWLAMPFFSPVPWEVDQFYSQKGMAVKNLNFEWYPIGTGPFLLSENNPNRRMILSKNPNFRKEYFPESGNEEDKKNGYLQHSGELVPLIEKAVYTLEKESIPRWNKFLQGYYDLSGISADSFDQAIHISSSGKPELSKSMQERKMALRQTIDTSIFYLGFNMLDPVVGGKSERARKLRLAISIAVNYDEHIAIFLNGRGKAAQGPIPPGIFGYKEGVLGINPYVYKWEDNKPSRRGLPDAKILMKEAGYPDGINPKTGQALILNYDVSVTGNPDDKAQLDWMRKQFAQLGIDLNIRATQYNRFQDKIRSGNTQIFSWGWSADYPDPENFLFMLYSKNGKVKYGGENASNYENPQYDVLFERMKNRPNDEERLALIEQMVEIVRKDAPWIWGTNAETLILEQQWVSPTKPNTISTSTLKYIAIDVPKRNLLREQWNRPIVWPLLLLLLLFVLLLIPLLFAFRQKESQKGLRIKL